MNAIYANAPMLLVIFVCVLLVVVVVQVVNVRRSARRSYRRLAPPTPAADAVTKNYVDSLSPPVNAQPLTSKPYIGDCTAEGVPNEDLDAQPTVRVGAAPVEQIWSRPRSHQ